MRKLTLPLLFACIVLATGCASYNGPKPITPQSTSVSGWVDSLRPTFRWEPTRPEATYELAVYEGFERMSFSFLHMVLFGPGAGLQQELTKGERVYSKTGITACEHTLDTDLKPQSLYIWSVRETGGVWMSRNDRAHRNWPVSFRTP